MNSMNAWGKSLDADKKSGIRFLGDQDGSFTRAWDLEFPAAPLLGTNRSKRYAIVIEGGKVKSVNIEPDNIGHTGMFKSCSYLNKYANSYPLVSGADKILGE